MYGGNFSNDLTRLYKIYQKDALFQKYLLEDCVVFGKEATEEQILFFLEEVLLTYFIMKMKVQFRNEYVPNHDRVLICYPGKPMKHMIYLMQQDSFKYGPSKNVYEMNWYDLTEKKLYDFTKIDLDEYSL